MLGDKPYIPIIYPLCIVDHKYKYHLPAEFYGREGDIVTLPAGGLGSKKHGGESWQGVITALRSTTRKPKDTNIVIAVRKVPYADNIR